MHPWSPKAPPPKKKSDKVAGQSTTTGRIGKSAAPARKRVGKAKLKPLTESSKVKNLVRIASSEKAGTLAMTEVPDFASTGLASAAFYFGALNREVVEDHLKTPGDFAIRLTMAMTPKGEKEDIVVSYVLSACSSANPRSFKHILIHWTRKGWTTDYAVSFPKMTELVEHYVTAKKPPSPKVEILLKTGVERPSFLLRDHQVVASDEILGRGNFGFVLKGRLNSNVDVVVKRTKAVMTDDERKAQIREAILMLDCHHLHTVHCYGIATDTLPIQIVMEVCDKGPLDAWLKKEKRAVPLKLKWCVQAARGLAFLETRRVIHRDVAARNCLICDAAQTLRVADMGMAQKADKDGRWKAPNRLQIPAKWAAPEVLADGLFSFASDAFAFGVLLWEILHDGLKPWADLPATAVVDLIAKGKRLEFSAASATPELVQEQAARCWNSAAERRPHLADVAAAFAAYDPNLDDQSSDLISATPSPASVPASTTPQL